MAMIGRGQAQARYSRR